MTSDDTPEDLVVDRHTLTAPDGWGLDVLDVRPAGPARGVVIAGHAMMVDRRTLYRRHRPSLAATLAHRGFRVLVPDLRGHGKSRRGPLGSRSWRYDDLVADTPLYLDLAHRLSPDLPVVTLGHSLFGHTALVYLATHPDVRVAGHVMVAVHIWNRRFSRRPWLWPVQRGVVEVGWAFGRLLGRVPARAAKIGSNDESLAYWRAVADCVREDRWVADDGTDYHAALAGADFPVLHVVSEGDWWIGEPEEALAFSAALPRRDVLRIGKGGVPSPGGAPAPDHMGVVTSARSVWVWEWIADWLEDLTASA